MQLPLCLLLSVVCGVEYSQLAAEDPPSEEEALLKRADLGGVGRDSFSASSESSDEAAAAAAMAVGREVTNYEFSAFWYYEELKVF